MGLITDRFIGQLALGRAAPALGIHLVFFSEQNILFDKRIDDLQRLIVGTTINSLLPDQTGHAGEFLTTDGITASWDVVPIGTVTSFSAGNLAPLFTTSVATATTTPALSFSLSSVGSGNLVFASPNGAPGVPSFRALVAADVPTLPYYSTVEDEAVPLTQRSTINFVGAGVTATDAGGKTVVTIPGGAAFVTSVTDTATIDLDVTLGDLTANVLLTATEIGFGDGSGNLTSSSDLTWNDATNTFTITGTIGLLVSNSANVFYAAQGNVGFWYTGSASTGLLAHQGFGIDFDAGKNLYTVGDVGITNNTHIEVDDVAQTIELTSVSTITASNLAGVGTRMVTATATGVLGAASIPVNTTIVNDPNWVALGDLVYGTGAATATILSGQINADNRYLKQTGTGAASAAPQWVRLDAGDITTGTLGIGNGGTGQTTANAALNALLPSQATHGAKFLQTDGTNTSWQAAAGGSLTVGTTTITSGTNTRILYDNAGVLGEYTLTGTGTVVAMQTAPTFVTSIETPLVIGGTTTTSTLTIKPTSASGITTSDIIFQANNSAEVFKLASGSSHVATLTAGILIDGFRAFSLTATMPAVITATSNAIDWQITSAGSSSFANRGFSLSYLAGYTGSSSTNAGSFTNSAAGTGANLTGITGNQGNSGNANATTTGYNFGLVGAASGGNISIGTIGRTTTAKNNATNIGIAGISLNTGTTPIQIGGFFGLMNSDPTFTSAALMCDNGSQTSDIFVARDNGTVSLRHIDGGNTFFGGTTTPTARVHIVAGTTAASTAPLKLTSGTNMTTAEAGAMEFASSQLYFTRAGTTRETIMMGNIGAAAPATTALTAFINYYGTGGTVALSTPNTWIAIVASDGNTYKVPCYS